MQFHLYSHIDGIKQVGPSNARPADSEFTILVLRLALSTEGFGTTKLVSP